MSKASLCGDPDCSTPYEFCEGCVRADERAKVREQIAREIEADRDQVTALLRHTREIDVADQYAGERIGLNRAARIARGRQP